MNESKPWLKPQKPVFIFSHPRTRSNLLAHILETHPLIGNGILYPFKGAHYEGPERRAKDGSAWATKEISPEDTFQYCYDNMKQKFQDDRQKGYIPIAKDHVFTILSTFLVNDEFPDTFNETHPVVIDGSDGTEFKDLELPQVYTTPNPTVLPESFLTSVTPVFTIRHPLPVMNSVVKIFFRSYGVTMNDTEVISSCSLKWTRILYDYYKNVGFDPIIIDGDELVRDTDVQMNKLCALIGVDPTQIQYEWKPKAFCTELSEETRTDVFRQTLYRSTGVIRDEEQLKIPKLDDEVRKWREEWGEFSAQKLKMMAEKAMEDYEYLSQFRL